MAESRPGSATSKLRCLLVEDNQPLLHATESLLRDDGHDIVGLAQTGGEALRLLEEQPTTVIVLDLRLPDLSGLEVARRAAEIVRRKTVVVVHTSYADARLVDQALEAGARGVVLKDGSPAALLAAISTAAAGGVYVDPALRRGRR
jgi:DNA-binding NarL/FixJ family response regulator